MSFSNFPLNKHILAVLEKLGYSTPTPIQQQTIPHILDGKDVLGLAQTGTGKTAAFSLPLLQKIFANQSGNKLQALILAPTRELADQTASFIEQFSAPLNLRCGVVYGGVSRSAQARKLKHGLDIIVACPGRLLDLMNSREADLSRTNMLVLDEADQMLDRGFLPDIKRILSRLPKQRQNLVFSATMPKEVQSLVNKVLTAPATVSINHKKPKGSIRHSFYHTDNTKKRDILTSLLHQKEAARAIVFTKTKYKAKKLALSLNRKGFRTTSLQGNLSQNKRQEALEGFKSGAYTVLVATDIAARGIDVAGITHVINYDMPDTIEAYTHRTGRTGRAEMSGQAVSFATDDDNKMVRRLEHLLKGKVTHHPVTEDSGETPSARSTAGERAVTPAPPHRRRKRKNAFNRRKPATA